MFTRKNFERFVNVLGWSVLALFVVFVAVVFAPVPLKVRDIVTYTFFGTLTVSYMLEQWKRPKRDPRPTEDDHTFLDRLRRNEHQGRGCSNEDLRRLFRYYNGRESVAAKNDDTRTMVRFSPQAYRAVEEIMVLGNYATFHDAVQRSISDELFIQKERQKGTRIMIVNDWGYKELVWPD